MPDHIHEGSEERREFCPGQASTQSRYMKLEPIIVPHPVSTKFLALKVKRVV